MSTFTDADYPAAPYPGTRPPFSYVHLDGQGWRVTPDDDLDEWLTKHNAATLAERVPVLTYGSNANPSKITWLRENLGLEGPVVVLRATCTGLSAVWAAGLRVVDTQRPVTLAAMPNVTEVHAVWMADPAQVAVLDVCEGRGDRYQLSRLHSGRVELDDGSIWDGLLAYTGKAEIRWPLLVSGAPVRLAEIGQDQARDLVGTAAPVMGLDVSVVDGPPDPDEFPARVFVYGTLKPGESAWELVEPWVDGEPYQASITGEVFDTGFGYPGLKRGTDQVPGWVLPLRSPKAALATLDSYEGDEYRRIRVKTPDGTICWTYLWKFA
ncbi:gamma-glutamylcyclotransferase [Kibdelosporangium aridum]|uniref:Gamma-glutamylcyclotransferase n=1 Tax=Kibdelosporangium aridum TaxID=2030 RepID=A0A428XXV5_KIBAR|nr:gamma-glutamylcyclotransferase [Kibdelosporangium aridum]RSM60032.1 gamma-glutamylcyclotransferase [Kibdelosporangium aridum]